MVLLSFLLPTRGRLNMLKESIQSLYDLAEDKSRIEVLIAMDNDDTTFADTQQYINEHPNRENIKIFVYERYGYKNLHMYINELCLHASGKYLVLWNDDARITSPTYDALFESYIASQDRLYVYQLKNNHFPNIFPIIPKEWFEIMGHFSLNAHNDSWIEEIALALGVNKQCGICAWHLRGVDSGNSIYSEVDSDCKVSSPDFSSEVNKRLRAEDIEKLRIALYKH